MNAFIVSWYNNFLHFNKFYYTFIMFISSDTVTAIIAYIYTRFYEKSQSKKINNLK